MVPPAVAGGAGASDRVLEPFEGPLGPRGDYDRRLSERVDLTGQDARGSLLTECRFDGSLLHDVTFAGARFVDCAFAGVQASSLDLSKAAWSDVTVTDSRLGGVVAFDAVWSRVRITGGKLDYVNLRAARLVDVTVTGAAIGELDLGGATLHRVRFVDCRIGELRLQQAKLSEVDISDADVRHLAGLDGMRGAVISAAQLHDLAPAFAAHLGITVAGQES